MTSGALAQLGAHHTGSVGVRGSSPLCSTRKAVSPSETAFFILSGGIMQLYRKHQLTE